jgi:diguanylate cyclase (GGDEF)-like protein
MGRTKTRPAYFDSLTGLPKLNLLKNRLNDYIIPDPSKKNLETNRLALVYLDINNFNYINEAFGHKAGGEVIKHVADYLVSKADNSGLVARVARDKFALLLTDIRSNAELYEIIDDIIINGCHTSSSDYAFYITMSAGIALYPEHGPDMNSLMKKAETAIYSAKKTGKDINIYSDELQRNMAGQVHMAGMLQAGIEKEEFTLYYQPEYNLNTNEVIGVEALVRWPHPENGFISPEVFIPVAERSKQIYELERWIVNKALQQKEQWEKVGLEHIELSINLSGKTLESESNFQKIERIISSYQVDYSRIIFEITETVIITHVDLATERLNRLRSYGIKIALDDFGTGYSSLSHITELPIDIIKIDKSFIKSIPEGNEETVITQSILSLGRDLNYRVVAEGIETQEQLEFLKRSSCERGQGFLLCEPLPSEKVDEVLRQ